MSKAHLPNTVFILDRWNRDLDIKQFVDLHEKIKDRVTKNKDLVVFEICHHESFIQKIESLKALAAQEKETNEKLKQEIQEIQEMLEITGAA